MIIQPSKVILRTCTIGGINHIELVGNNSVENFSVHSLRIYEDICKSYFTAQLIIEDQINSTDPYLYPAVPVVISFMSLPNNKTYTEKFRIYSIESKPKENDKYAGMLITINLMGDEYFNDTQNTVMMNIPNKTATAAASDIHNQYLQENGSLVIQGSKGFIGTTDTPHEVVNKKPIKAIHDLLDKAVSITVDTSAFVYFRNKPGYVIAPLEHLLKSSSVLGNFIHKPAAGNTLADVLVGYNNIIHLRPMAPPSQDTAQGSRSAELDSMSKTGAFFDMNTGNFTIQSGKSGIEKNFAKFGKGQQSLAVIAKELLGGTVKSQFGSRIMNTVINEHRQKREIDKNGPGGYNTKEEAFIASLSFSKKYWISVPMQSGIDVTIGNRINVVYPIGTGITAKTLFVARLIHELQFKTPGQKTFEPVQGTTDMFCVEY